ncbi:MAG: choice-of-anchor Q domain-containing protein [Dongiaceae bacterium]
MNSTISGNAANTGGGGIANGNVTQGFRLPPLPNGRPIDHGIPAELTALNVTLAANSAHAGGNLLHVAASTATLKNTLLAGALAGSDCSGAITSLSHNLHSDGTCALNGPGDISNLGQDAGVLPLADNGGPTQTHSLGPGGCGGDAYIQHSPAIDSGDNAACPSTDQRGIARPFDWNSDGSTICDIGAFEQHDPPINTCTGSCPPSPPTPTPSSASPPSASPTPAAVLPIALPRSGGGPDSSGSIPPAVAAVVISGLAGVATARRAVRRR